MSLDFGLLLLRVLVGLVLLAHGFQKVFGWWGGPGLARWNAEQAERGVRSAWLWGGAASLGELAAGAGLILGLVTPIAAAQPVGEMLVAMLLAHRPLSFWNRTRGIEYPLVLMGAGASIGLAGPGRFSLDAILGVALPSPETFLFVAALTLLGVAVMMATRRPVPLGAAPGGPGPVHPPEGRPSPN